ncbi:hypothetical protein [Lactobacillus crispatus]|uniref:hypothetical protein n=1 Tax=Lactobacillus crispatus TaxID=47770 RepID=UPI0021A271B9|nr:hypothetical protein [Lactobacillus crispatus]MCT3539748.1 hypothetical protein [Lactobacillus crispatus]
MRSYCKQINKHGQETMMFKCDQCGHEVAIDAYDMFVAEFNVFCPVCGANAEHLTVANEEINFKLEDVKKFGVTFNDASKVFKDFRKGGH